eukprot:310-Eustigmatos_ZCMA.PRE.1
MRSGFSWKAGRPAAMKWATCWLVACEQLPETMACPPATSGKALACGDGDRPKFAGSAMATPEPAVTRAMSLSAGPRRS